MISVAFRAVKFWRVVDEEEEGEVERPRMSLKPLVSAYIFTSLIVHNTVEAVLPQRVLIRHVTAHISCIFGH